MPCWLCTLQVYGSGSTSITNALLAVLAAGVRQRVYFHHSKRPGYKVVARSGTYIQVGCVSACVCVAHLCRCVPGCTSFPPSFLPSPPPCPPGSDPPTTQWPLCVAAMVAMASNISHWWPAPGLPLEGSVNHTCPSSPPTHPPAPVGHVHLPLLPGPCGWRPRQASGPGGPLWVHPRSHLRPRATAV